MFSSLKFHVPGSLTSWAPIVRPGCQMLNTAPSVSASTRHPAGVEDVEGLGEHLPAGLLAFAAVSSAFSTQT